MFTGTERSTWRHLGRAVAAVAGWAAVALVVILGGVPLTNRVPRCASQGTALLVAVAPSLTLIAVATWLMVRGKGLAPVTLALVAVFIGLPVSLLQAGLRQV